MTTHKFLASDSASAMEEVVKKLGPDALIISTSKRGNKVEIEATNSISKNTNKHQFGKINEKHFSEIMHSKIDILREKQRNRLDNGVSIDMDPRASKSDINERGTHELNKVRDQINNLQNMLAGMVITNETGLNESIGNSTSFKLRQFEFTPEIVSALKPAFDGLSVERGCAAFLKAFSKRIGCCDSQEIFRSRIFFIVGPSGVGKTTIAAKLAARIMEERKENRPILVSTEGKHSTKKNDLSFYSKLLNLPKLHQFIEKDYHGLDQICDGQKIVDVSSSVKEAKYFIKNVREKVGATKVTTILCLPAGSNKQFIINQIGIYSELKPVLAFTKADECQLLPRELCVLSDKNIKMAFLTGSKTILGSLAISEPDVLASYLETYLLKDLENE